MGYVGTFGQPIFTEYSVKYRICLYVGTSGQPTFYRILGKTEQFGSQRYIHSVSLCFFFRRRSFVCPFFDHDYKGTSNKVMKAWNDCLIYFVPLLCSLVESTAASLREVLEDEQGGLLLYQQTLSQIQEVCTYPFLAMYTFPFFAMYTFGKQLLRFHTGTSFSTPNTQ